jgi:hypothetical protein
MGYDAAKFWRAKVAAGRPEAQPAVAALEPPVHKAAIITQALGSCLEPVTPG